MASVYRVYNEIGVELVLDRVEDLGCTDELGTPLYAGRMSRLPPVPQGALRTRHMFPGGDVVLVDDFGWNCEVRYRVNLPGDGERYGWQVLCRRGTGVVRAMAAGSVLVLEDTVVNGYVMYTMGYNEEEAQYCRLSRGALERAGIELSEMIELFRAMYEQHIDLPEVLSAWQPWAQYRGCCRRACEVTSEAKTREVRYCLEALASGGTRRYYLGDIGYGHALIPLDEFPENVWEYVSSSKAGVMYLNDRSRPNGCEAAFFVCQNGRHRWARVSHGPLLERKPGERVLCEWHLHAEENFLVAINVVTGDVYAYDIQAGLRARTRVAHHDHGIHVETINRNTLALMTPKPDDGTGAVDYDVQACVPAWEKWENFGEPEGDVPARRGLDWATAALPLRAARATGTSAPQKLRERRGAGSRR